MNLRKTMIVGLAGCAAMAMSACGSDESEPTASPTTTTSSAGGLVDCENPPAEPTSEDLQNILDTALDPAAPTDEKANLIEGGADDPEVWDKLATALSEAQGITYEVSSGDGAIAMLDDCNLSVGFTLKLSPDSQPTVTQIDFVAEDGQWKFSRTHACQLVQTMAIETPMCPAA